MTFVGSTLSYQFDTAKDPPYPVLLPPPQNVSYGTNLSLIDPCFFTVNTVVSNPDLQSVIDANIK